MIGYLFLVVLLFYLLMMLYYGMGIHKVNKIKLTSKPPNIAFSIIIPFRNEAKNLPALIRSLEQLSYPRDLFEVILVDDDSSDGYLLTTAHFNLKVIHNQRTTSSPKKDALTTGVNAATFDWVITTDADCQFPNQWLEYWEARVKKGDAELICGPVSYFNSNGFLSRFQQVELWALQGVTMGSFGQSAPLMCNGAHMGYAKSFFHSLGGFDGNTQWAGGDDVFLLHKAVSQSPKHVGYLFHPEALVLTQPATTWKGLFQQRLRWAAKAKAYQNWKAIAVACLVFATNAIVIFSQILFFTSDWKWGFIPLVKIAVDDAMQRYMAARLQQKTSSAFWSGILYPWFSVGVTFLAMLGKYQWKGRRY